MNKSFLLLFLTFISMRTFSQDVKRDTSEMKPIVYLIGSIHSRHFDPKYHYSIIDLQKQIVALKPDLVCGEITPEAYNQPMEGYFPLEAAFLAEMSSKLNYRFEPVDWRLDNTTQSKAESEYPQFIKEKSAPLIKKLNDSIEVSNRESIYDFFHDKTTLQLIDSLYDGIICTSALAEIASGSWNERNRRIIENGITVAGNAHTIVFVFGIDHLPQLQKYLRDLGIEAQIPQRLFVPSNDYKVSDTVLNRWKQNLENLRSIRDKKIPVSYDNYQKVIHSSRIQELEKAIQKSE